VNEDEAGPEFSRVRNLSTGQVAEWLVWTRLAATSGGDLHVFLPLDDRGIDGIVHRISTDRYARVQVKGRTVHPRGGIAVQVTAGELVDDLAVLVAVDVDLASATMSDYALVVPAPSFRDLAQRNVTGSGEVLYETEVLLPPASYSPWARWCVPADQIGDRLLAPPVAPPAVVAQPSDWIAARRLGYRAEMEMLRRAADRDELNVFKAFPDLEPNEYLLYHTGTREVVGIQVKSVTFRAGATEAHVSVYRPALRPSAHTWFVVLLHDDAKPGFLPHCVVIPSTVVAEHLTGHSADGQVAVTRGVTGLLAPWRTPLATLGSRLAELPG
jgi:hypothetical protein